MLVSWCSPGLESCRRDFRFLVHISRLTSKLNSVAPKSYQWKRSDGHEPTGPASLSCWLRQVSRWEAQAAPSSHIHQLAVQHYFWLDFSFGHADVCDAVQNTRVSGSLVAMVKNKATRRACLSWKNQDMIQCCWDWGSRDRPVLSFAFSSSHTSKRRTSSGHTMMVWQEREKEAPNKGNQRCHLSWRCVQVHSKY